MIDLDIILTQLKMIARREQIKISKQAIFVIAIESAGSMRSAISLLGALSTYGGKITSEVVRNVLSIANVEKLSKLVLEGNLPGAMREAEWVCSVNSAKNTLQSLYITLSRLGKSEPEGDLARIMGLASYFGEMSRRPPGLSDIATLQCCLAHACAFSKPQLTLDTELWSMFCLSVPPGVHGGFYPPSIEIEIMSFYEVKADTGQKVVWYKNGLGDKPSPELIEAFSDYADEDYKWRLVHDKDKVRRKKSSRRRKRIKEHRRHTAR